MNTLRFRRFFVGQACATVLVLVVTSLANALCDQSAASKADSDLWQDHGCWQEFFLWQYRAYDMRESDWRGRGWNDACNNLLEYPKHWNAAYLVTYGLVDNNDQSFHGTIDYRATAEAADSRFHASLYHLPSDDNSFFGQFQPVSSGPNQLITDCPLYDPGVANANPASRAGDFMHEGWHAWLNKYNWNNGSAAGHRPCTKNPDGTCTNGACTVNGCDYFYFHGIAAYVFGALWETDGTANRFHSPNQVQVEFLCDVADQPQNWVPASVRTASKSDADQRAVQRFINGPGYKCGEPRPW
jgi:hypothetical protein